MKYYLIVLSLVINLTTLPPALATSLKPLDLERLSIQAPLIIYGEVINNRALNDRQSGQIVTLTTFKVIELIKGNTGEEHTIKQIGGQLTDSNIKMHIPGVPRFNAGSKYVVFLAEKSQLGFSSPLGLYQGTFSVKTINGEQVISNGSMLSTPSATVNRPVQIPLAVNTQKPTQTRLSDFINTVRSYNVK